MAQSGEGKPRVVIDGYDAEVASGGLGVTTALLRSEVVKPMASGPVSFGALTSIGRGSFGIVTIGEVA